MESEVVNDEVKLSAPRPAAECYPNVAVHTWNEFPLLAVELGGYRDITVVNPYNGQTLWVGDAFDKVPPSDDRPEGVDRTTYDALRELVVRMEETKFLG